MNVTRARQLAAVAWGFQKYLRSPLTLQKAADDIRLRLDGRQKNFLRVARELVYDNPFSPYRKLLLWAGCTYADLEDTVRREGIEKTLEKLRDEGVYLTLEEFKATSPIVRRGLTIEPLEADFDNPVFMGKGIEGSTSGSRSRGTRVLYDWHFFAEEAANELILYETHGISGWSSALWMPQLPAISGIHNLLINIKFHRPFDKWFSHLREEMIPLSLRDRLELAYIVCLCRGYGLRVPKPEFAGIGDAGKVAAWLADARKSGGGVLKTYASSAVRVAQVAIDNDLDISGSFIFAGAEPLTERRRRFIESAGAKVYPRYVATETGLIGASCPYGDRPDEMHLYLDRLAVVQRERTTAIGKCLVNSFIFTTLSLNTGKILLNTEIGDFGKLRVKPCSCLFGGLGMDVHLSEVRSHDKLTGEGMTLLGSDLDDIVGELIEGAGGSPNDYQFWETQDENGLYKLDIAVSPSLHALNEVDFREALLKKLRDKNQGATTTSHIWQQAHTVRVVRSYPEMTKGSKLLPIMPQPAASSREQHLPETYQSGTL